MKHYLISTRKQFEYYKHLGEKTFSQLTEAEIHCSLTTESNSIFIIVKHLHGNMLSRFTDFLTSDGEKSWRNRDQEFESTHGESDYLKLWKQGWQKLFDTLDELAEEDLEKIVYIRNEGHTVVEALNRQLCHYAYHVGQIVFIGKCLKNESWLNLSIPKSQSEQYNQQKFKEDKGIRNFIDGLK